MERKIKAMSDQRGTTPWPQGNDRCRIMAVVNATPNSFSDGGDFHAPAAALAQALKLQAEGADILDLGGESTHPLAAPVETSEEIARVLPVLNALKGKLSVPISIDTYKAATAQAALQAGASIVNDVWGLQHDPAMADVVAAHKAGICIMHNRRSVDETLDILADVMAFFERSLELAARAGIPESHIVLDPGIGFGKTPEQSMCCIWGLGAFRHFGLPLLVGASRKGFIGKITGQSEPKQRLAGTIAAHIAAKVAGAAYIRVHDVRAHHDALAVFDAINPLISHSEQAK